MFADYNHRAPKPLSKMFKPNPRRLVLDSEHGGKIANSGFKTSAILHTQ